MFVGFASSVSICLYFYVCFMISDIIVIFIYLYLLHIFYIFRKTFYYDFFLLFNCRHIQYIHQSSSNAVWSWVNLTEFPPNHTTKPSNLLSHRNITICPSTRVKTSIIFISFLHPTGKIQFNWISRAPSSSKIDTVIPVLLGHTSQTCARV